MLARTTLRWDKISDKYLKQTLRWEEKRRVKVSWPVRERRRTRRSPRPTGARIDLQFRM